MCEDGMEGFKVLVQPM
jgi:hypothetical protein